METPLCQRTYQHLLSIYAELHGESTLAQLTRDCLQTVQLADDAPLAAGHENKWDAGDIAVITYADSILSPSESPLQTLKTFADEKLKPFINTLHILPFFPYSSDDGFAVKDFYAVRDDLGDWDDIQALTGDYRLMADLVLNHGSAQSQWFENFRQGKGDGHDYFFTTAADTRVSEVVRPRTSPLLCATDTASGIQYVWCTFSHDQVDFDFRNPAVLLEFIRILRFYLDQGIRLFRMDAVAFIWKQADTRCLNLPQTHELVRLMRLLVETAAADAVIITETNIPNRENLSYFGNANEAHWVYNFSLPPLLLHTLVSGSCRYLRQWLMTMPPAQNGTTYFNFIASHDGIGLRPAEGLLTDNELAVLLTTMQGFGGEISWRTDDNGIKQPYEINIALFDALQGTSQGPDMWHIERYLCAHAVMLALEGVPAFYIHSLLATGNDYERLAAHQHNRAINRHQWEYEALIAALDDEHSHHQQIFSRLGELISIRREQPAFHPNATQFTLQLSEQLFGFWRQSPDRRQNIFCVFNISSTPQSLNLSDLNLIVTDNWQDLVTGNIISDNDTSLTLEPYRFIWLSNV